MSLRSQLMKEAVPRARFRHALATVILLLLGSVGANAVAEAGNWTGNYPPCDRHSEVLSHSHMNLAVRFATSDRRLAAQFARAMDFWATVLDMEWRIDNSRGCALAVVDGSARLFEPGQAARAQFPYTPAFQGWIAFNLKRSMRGDEQYFVAVHELGHLFGLVHNSSPSSVMYFLYLEGRVFLDGNDLMDLAAHHTLRAGRVGEQPIQSVPVLDLRQRSDAWGRYLGQPVDKRRNQPCERKGEQS